MLTQSQADYPNAVDIPFQNSKFKIGRHDNHTDFHFPYKFFSRSHAQILATPKNFYLQAMSTSVNQPFIIPE